MRQGPGYGRGDEVAGQAIGMRELVFDVLERALDEVIKLFEPVIGANLPVRYACMRGLFKLSGSVSAVLGHFGRRVFSVTELSGCIGNLDERLLELLRSVSRRVLRVTGVHGV